MDWCICILCALSKKFRLFIIVISNICKKVLRILSLLFSIIFMITYATSFFYNGVKSSDASLSSNYDYSEPWDKNNFVRLCIFIFSIFTTIIVVNLLIAFVNDIYTKTSENSDMHDTLHSLNSIYFPPTIIYEANADEVEKHNRNRKFLKIKLNFFYKVFIIKNFEFNSGQ
ncbi:unnamed protein product [Rhizophagus irregularis]|nr:unnamed protein product [Rhizophagus irregularis]